MTSGFVLFAKRLSFVQSRGARGNFLRDTTVFRDSSFAVFICLATDGTGKLAQLTGAPDSTYTFSLQPLSLPICGI
jgi:hypothetical protein